MIKPPEPNLRTLTLTLAISLFASGLVWASDAPPERRSKEKKAETTNRTGPVEIDNDYYRVLKNAAADAAANTNIGARVIVALTNVNLHSRKGDLES